MTTCKTCRHWEEGIDRTGWCRRHAPQLVEGLFFHRLDPDGDNARPDENATWPRTCEGDWCGEWEGFAQ